MFKSAVFFLIAFTSTLAWAQRGNSVISGTGEDATGAAVSDAKIKVTNLESGLKLDTLSNDAGLYRIGTLVPGNYQIEVDAGGFDHLSRGPITLQVDQTFAID